MNDPRGAMARLVDRAGEWGGRDPYNMTLGFAVAFVVGLGMAGFTTSGALLAAKLLDGLRDLPRQAFERKVDKSAETAPPAEAPEKDAAPPPPPTFIDWWFLIAKQNLRIALLAAAGGILARFIPWGIVLLNGFGLGMLVMAIRDIEGVDPIHLFLFLAPHGVIEIPALLLSCIIGVRLHRVASPPTLAGRGRAFLKSWRALLLVAAMLLVAAAIEVW